jgi:hypothetical protein
VGKLPLLATAAAIAVCVLAIVSSGGSAQQTGERTLVFKETNKGATFAFVDNPPKSRSRNPDRASISGGDVFVFGNNLLDSQKRRAGRIEGSCTAVRANRRFARATFVCHAIAGLTDGTISVSADVNLKGPTITGSIDGGTGAYQQARGFFTSTGEPSTDTFHVLP